MSNRLRQTYYEKLGYNLASKKNLEILLDENKIKDLSKLKLFSEINTIQSSQQRIVLWGYLSGLMPIYPKNHEYIFQQRNEEFSDLFSAVFNIKLVEEKENTPLEQIFYMMWLLETRQLPFGNKLPPNEEHPFIPIAKTLLQLFEAEYQVYWIAKTIHGMASGWDMNGLVAQTYSELEVIDPNLLRELEKKNLLDQLPALRWFRRCFAGVVIPISLARIWDKLFGGAPKILVYLFIKMLVYLNSAILACDSYEEAEKTFLIFRDDQEAADWCVNKSIELLEMNNKK